MALSSVLSRLRAGPNALGFSTTVPSEQTGKVVMPTSTPMAGPSWTGGAGSHVSTAKQANHLPAVRLTVTSQIRPLNLTSSTMATGPNPGQHDHLAVDPDRIRPVVGTKSLLVPAPLEPREPDPPAVYAPLPLGAVLAPPGGCLAHVYDRVLGGVLGELPVPGGDDMFDPVPAGTEGFV